MPSAISGTESVLSLLATQCVSNPAKMTVAAVYFVRDSPHNAVNLGKPALFAICAH